jgi:hypothetical protein
MEATDMDIGILVARLILGIGMAGRNCSDGSVDPD